MNVSLTARRTCAKYNADTNMFDSHKGLCKPIHRIYVPFAFTNGTANTDCIPLLSLQSAWKTQGRELCSPTLSTYRTESSFSMLTPHKIMDLTSLRIFFFFSYFPHTMLCWGPQSPLGIKLLLKTSPFVK